MFKIGDKVKVKPEFLEAMLPNFTVNTILTVSNIRPHLSPLGHLFHMDIFADHEGRIYVFCPNELIDVA